MNRRIFINNTIAAGMISFIPVNILEALSLKDKDIALDEDWMDNCDIIPAPDDPTLWEKWRNDLCIWRDRKKHQLNYNGSSYLSEPFKWVSSDFSCCFLMTCDTEFYDYQKNEYTINRLIERGKKEYGGYDSVVLWHAYPRIGLDDRNQFDFYREMPFGISGVKEVVRQFHDHGIRVFINYNPWDRGTRREQKPDIDMLVDIIRSIDADGIFLDTMKDAPDFREKIDGVKEGVVMEGEIALPLEHIQTHHMSWAQWFKDSNVPGVYRNKWFERHHIQHAIARWNSDKTAQLQTAWMNGSGILIWENVFGQCLDWSERDKAIYRIMYSLQHRFEGLFSGEEWIPLSHQSSLPGVYISSWGDEKNQLWTIVNRNDSPVSGNIFETMWQNDARYFDLVKGEEILNTARNGRITFTGTISSRGIACFISIFRLKIDNEFLQFLSGQKKLYQSFSDDIQIPERNNKVENRVTVVNYKSVPAGMVLIPHVSKEIKFEYTFRECGAYGNIQEHLQLAATHRLHSLCQLTKQVEIKKFAIDEIPVTNLMFLEFLEKTGYLPRIPDNFLKHWVDGHIPPGKEDHPVVYIDIDDARAYALWAGKRLPSEDEWQFAAEGMDSFNYPWGNEMEEGKCNNNSNGETASVKAFPGGVSPFGCYDMCGNTWELTGNEYNDGRTRFIMLKGGSAYKAAGSEWYMDGGPQKNSFVAKMLLIWPGLDRCATVGFRCAIDL